MPRSSIYGVLIVFCMLASCTVSHVWVPIVLYIFYRRRLELLSITYSHGLCKFKEWFINLSSFLQNLVTSLQTAEAMAGHNESSASGKKSTEATNDVPTLNAESLQSNMKIIYYRFVLSTF